MTGTAPTPDLRSETTSSVVAEALGGGRRGRGAVVLGVLVVAAVLVPVVLVLVFRAEGGSAALGLTLGLLLDLLAGVLLLGVVSHKVTNRRLARVTRSVQRLQHRTDGLGRALDRERTATASRPAAARGPVGAGGGMTRQDLILVVRDTGDRLQATQNLFALVTPRGPVPQMWGYIAAPDVLVLLVHKLLTRRPSVVVECGSGTSTLFLALAIQQYGLDCRLVSLEHEAAYAASTRALLADHGVQHLADVRHAPLTPTPLTDHEGPWYDPAAYADLHDIGLAFVDGPPGDVGRHARYPMVPLLGDRLAARCTIVLDDMKRADERAVADRWAPLLPDFDYRYLPLIRGAGVFTRGD